MQISVPSTLRVDCTKTENRFVEIDLNRVPAEVILKMLHHGAHSALNDAHSQYAKKGANAVADWNEDTCVSLMTKRVDAWYQGEWATRGSGVASEPADPLGAMTLKVAKEWTYRDYGQGATYKATKDKPATGTYRATPAQVGKLQELANRKGWLHTSSLEKAECLERIIEIYVKAPAVIKEAKRRLEAATAIDLPDL